MSRTGTVLRSTGAHYRVRLDDGSLTDCRLAGKMRLHGLKTTNPVAVGDHVQTRQEGHGLVITEVLPRRNHIIRKSVNLSKRIHVLCANVDQAFVLVTLDQPETTLGYIDRLLVSCEAYEIPVTLLFNKVDLLEGNEKKLLKLEDYELIYRIAGYPTRRVQLNQELDRAWLTTQMQGQVTMLLGLSGSGKSSLVHTVAPELGVRIGKISDFSGRGKHTTTFAEMFELPFGGFIIDSPGFKEMEVYDITPFELSFYFPEMKKFRDGCKFNNCLHESEAGCAVRKAAHELDFAPSRYHTYLNMLEEIRKTRKEDEAYLGKGK